MALIPRLPKPPRLIKRPRHFWWNPRAPELLEALKKHKVRGTPVFLGHPDMEIRATILEQRFGGVGAQFLLKLKKPLNLEDYAVALDIRESLARKVYEEASRFGHIDSSGRLTYIWARWMDTALDVSSSPNGTLVEYQDADPRRFLKTMIIPGKIVGRKLSVGKYYEDLIYMELFEPIHTAAFPRRAAINEIKPGFHSQLVYFVPERIYEVASKDAIKVLGPGKPIEGLIGYYALEQPRNKDEVIGFLESYGVKYDMLSLFLFFILPLWYPEHDYGSLFRPMREDLAKGLELEVYEGAEWLEGLT